jgi:hypothetical protein
MERYTERRKCRSQPSVRSEVARRGIRELKMIKGQPLSAVKTLPTVHHKATQTYINFQYKMQDIRFTGRSEDQRLRGREDQREENPRVNVTE